jgi:hypothetical protein
MLSGLKKQEVRVKANDKSVLPDDPMTTCFCHLKVSSADMNWIGCFAFYLIGKMGYHFVTIISIVGACDQKIRKQPSK